MTWSCSPPASARLAAAGAVLRAGARRRRLPGVTDAAVLGVYAELDNRVNATRDAAEAALTAAGLTHELAIFDGVDHAFFNDTGQRYDAERPPRPTGDARLVRQHLN